MAAVFRVNEKGAYSDLAVSAALRGCPLGHLDRSLVTELVSGSVKRRNTLDWVLERYLPRGMAQTPPWTRNILRLGAYQLLYLDRIPASAACDTSVELAKSHAPGTAGMVNAVLRRLSREGFPELPAFESDPIGRISLEFSHPSWLVERWLARWGREWTERMCRADNESPPLALRVNGLKSEAAEVAAEMRGLGCEVQESIYIPEGLLAKGVSFLERLAGILEGRFVFQDEGSMLISRALSPVPGSMVVDACAGLGTKATHLAQLIGNEGEILAVDLHHRKLALLEKSCRRLGVTCVRTVAGDARRLAKILRGPADFVLVDAPCSGLGVLRRRADARWRKTPENINSLPRLQLELLEGAWEALSPGGVLVYSTCTTEPEENEMVVSQLLRRHDDLHTEDLNRFLPRELPREEDRKRAATGRLQLYPHIHGTDGFFLARLRKH